MAAHMFSMFSYSRRLFSCNVHNSLQILCTAVRPNALQVTSTPRLSSLIMSQTSSFSTCYIQANAWKSEMRRITNLPRLVCATRSIYTLDFASSFAKQSLLIQSSGGLVTTKRFVNSRNKHGKPKTVHAVAKRFFRIKGGGLIYWPPGKNHFMIKKGPEKSRQLRKPRLCTKQQLKVLNKMLGRYKRYK